MPPFFKNIDCISFKVDDLDQAIAFYSQKLEQKLLWKTPTAAGLAFGEGSSELVLYTEDRPAGTDLLVESVPEAIQRFIQTGGKLLFGPIDIPVGQFAVVTDPFGNALNILDLSKGTYQVDESMNVISVAKN